MLGMAVASLSHGNATTCRLNNPKRRTVATCSAKVSVRRRDALFSSVSLALLWNTPGLATELSESQALRVGEAIREVMSKTKAPGVLRLVFHDAGTFNVSKGTGGMNGSIIRELDRPENAGLERSVKVLKKAREKLEPSLQVSWADLIAVAGSEAVKLCGGPSIPVRLGRLDSGGSDPEGELPNEDSDAFTLKRIFQRKGFSTQEMVALSGAHTLGGKGFGDPTVFDNSYYQVLLNRPWTVSGNKMASMIGLPSDRALVDDEECFKWITTYKEDQSLFYTDFTAAYVKLVNLGARSSYGAYKRYETRDHEGAQTTTSQYCSEHVAAWSLRDFFKRRRERRLHLLLLKKSMHSRWHYTHGEKPSPALLDCPILPTWPCVFGIVRQTSRG